MAIFSLGHVNSASLNYLISIKAIDLVCPQAILAMSVTLFPFGMSCVTKILSINRSYTLFCSKLCVKYVGESFMPVGVLIF